MTGSSSTLPDSVRGTSLTATISFGHVPRGAVLADPRPDRLRELLVELRAVAQHDEQRHEVLLALLRDVDDQRVGHLVEREHGAVDLRRAHADPAAVDRRVRAAGDDRRAALGDLDPVAVAPDAGEHVEVALAVALAALVVPEEQRHRGHRLGDHQLADLADQRLALLAPGLDRRAQRARLQLALVDRHQRAAAHERRAQVGAAAGREQPRVRADVLVDPAEALGGERRAGRADRLQLRQVAAVAGLDLRLHARRRCSSRWCRTSSPPPTRRGPTARPCPGWPGAAVVEHDRGVGEQAADQEVPHHPAGRGEPEEAVAGLQRPRGGGAS